jgi:DNA uptake lipoprotein
LNFNTGDFLPAAGRRKKFEMTDSIFEMASNIIIIYGGSMKKQYFLLAVFLLFFVLPAPAQWVLSPADSSTFENAKKDPQRLRQIVNEHRGNRIGAKAQNQLGLNAFNEKRFNDAEQEFLTTSRQYSNLPEAYEAAYFLGVVTDQNERFEEAKRQFRDYLRNNPGDRDAERWQYLLIRTMSETKDPEFIDSAHAFLANQHKVTKENDVVVQNELVRYYDEKKDYTQALAEALKLVKEYPKSPYVHFVEGRIAEYYMLLDDTQGAIDYCNALINKYPANTDDAARAQLMLAIAYKNNNDLNRARVEYAKVGKMNPSVHGRVNAAEYYSLLLDMREANAKNDTAALTEVLKNLKAFVKRHPTDHHVPKALMDIADLSRSRGNYQEALTAYDSIIQFDSSLVVTGKVHRRSKDLKEHRALVQETHMAKGMMLRLRLHNPKAALTEFVAVLDRNPNRTDALLNKAVCLLDLGQKNEARPILQRLVNERTDVMEAAAQLLSTL